MNGKPQKLKLPESLRDELKKPFGNVAKDARGIPKNKTIICVGDIACDDALKAGLKPIVCVYDNKSNRGAIKPLASIRDYPATEVGISNPAGELSASAFTEIRKARDASRRTKILVEGEEDLITLAAIKEAAEGWIVVYGQPNEGLVVVEVDEKIKTKVEKILNQMR